VALLFPAEKHKTQQQQQESQRRLEAHQRIVFNRATLGKRNLAF
jgi:hypothetical protein